MGCFKKGANIDISKFSFPYPDDVGRYNHHLLGPIVTYGNPHWHVHTLSISSWAMTLIPFVTTHHNDIILSAFGFSNQTSQEVTHLGTTFA
jgi:hypothetical protein